MTDQSTALVAGGTFVEWTEDNQETFERENEAAKVRGSYALKENAENYVRVLPPVQFPDPNSPGGVYKMPHPHVEIYQHFYDFPGDLDKKVKFNCPLMMSTRTLKLRDTLPCPQCESLQPYVDAKPAFNSPDGKLLYDRSAKRVLIFNVVDLLLPEAGVLKWYVNPRKGTRKGPGPFELLEELRTADGYKYWSHDGAPGRRLGVNICLYKEKGSSAFDVSYKLIRAKFEECALQDIADGMYTAKQWADLANDLRVEQLVPRYDECRAIMRGEDPRAGAGGDGNSGPAAGGGRRTRGPRAQDRIEGDD
jgi:hypothetical protein